MIRINRIDSTRYYTFSRIAGTTLVCNVYQQATYIVVLKNTIDSISFNYF